MDASSIISLLALLGLLVAVFALLFWAYSKLLTHHNNRKSLSAVFSAITEIAAVSLLAYYLIPAFNDVGSPMPPLESAPRESEEWETTINRIDLPEIPLLPPSSASASYILSDHRAYCQIRSPACGTLLTLAADIVLSIRDAGFPEVAIFFGYEEWFDVSPKVIIVTPTERVYRSGEPVSLERFNDTRPQALRDRSWVEFLRLLFDGREGRLRFFVVEVGVDEYVPFSSSPYSYYNLTDQVETGAVRLPAILHDFIIEGTTHVTFHVYEYNALRGQEPIQVESDRPPADHLALTGIHLPGLTSD
ncbi:MAG: hypothetical protein AAF376_01750 [Pseudomonadota bacterium]